MRRIFLIALASMVLTSVAADFGSASEEQDKLALARVTVDSRREGMYLVNNFDETHNHRPGRVELLLWPGDAQRLTDLGYDFEITVPDVVARDQKLLAQPVPVVELPGPDRDSYRVLTDYNNEMTELAEANPKLVKVLELPHQTLEGRTVFGLEISANVKAKDARPVFYVDGVHHAREWPAAEYPMIFAHHLVEGYGKDARITKLLKDLRVIIVPVVNPDGFDYSRSSPLAQQNNVDGAHSTPCGLLGCEGYWRKNRRSFTGLTVPAAQKNPDAYGVDPNRNYSFHWGGGGSSDSPADQTNRGAAPFSEPETQNVRDLLTSRNVTGIVSNHTSGRLVLRAWGDTYKHAPDEKYLFNLGAKMAEAMGGYQNIKGIQLYVTTGTMSDWGYGTLGIPSYTFEHGRVFHPPYSGCDRDCVGAEWKGVMNAYLHLAEAALDERAHGVIKGRVVGSGGAAKLAISRKYAQPLTPGNPLNEESVAEKLNITVFTRPDGSFAAHLPPSTRPHLRATGKTEKFVLTVGGKKVSFVLGRGQRLNLGTIRL